MASLLARHVIGNVTRRSFHVAAVVRADKVMPDPISHATGLEKFELLAKQAGNPDPFFLRAVTRTKGSREEPTVINAMEDHRMVGCVCREEDTNIKWMWLTEGMPRRCECGYWMELKVHPAPDKFALPN